MNSSFETAYHSVPVAMWFVHIAYIRGNVLRVGFGMIPWCGLATAPLLRVITGTRYVSF